MNSKSIEKLEFNKIREILKNYTITYLGKKRINSLYHLNKFQMHQLFYIEKVQFH